MLPLMYPHSAGLDVHKRFVSACRLVVDDQGRVHPEWRQFSTMTGELEALAQWLADGGVTHVALESTGVYWQPVYNILEGRFELYLVNPQAVKRMPGRKTDMGDAEWLATLMQHGLVQRSFIPSREQRDLRELARYRQTVADDRARVLNRLQKVLEGTNIKLMSVASDVEGVSAQAILHSLLAGQTDPHQLAQLARGRLRQKRDLLEQALVGHIRPQQRFMLALLLGELDFYDEELAQLDARLEEVVAAQPLFAQAVTLLDTIPGINRHLALLIVGEIGVDMARFPSDRHLAAWAGLAPGNNETGGRQRPSQTRQGNRHLRRALALAAHAAKQTKDTYLRARYYRIMAHRGKLRAIIAVGRTILRIAYHLLQDGQPYRDLGSDYYDRLDRERTKDRLVRRLTTLGFEVTVAERIA